MIDLQNGEFDILPDMRIAIMAHASVFFNGCVYVAGGENGASLNNFEK